MQVHPGIQAWWRVLQFQTEVTLRDVAERHKELESLRLL